MCSLKTCCQPVMHREAIVFLLQKKKKNSSFMLFLLISRLQWKILFLYSKFWKFTSFPKKKTRIRNNFQRHQTLRLFSIITIPIGELSRPLQWTLPGTTDSYVPLTLFRLWTTTPIGHSLALNLNRESKQFEYCLWKPLSWHIVSWFVNEPFSSEIVPRN